MDLRRGLDMVVGRRMLIVGDVMLDQYQWCDVDRISPEAPVPIARVRHVTHAPGGAANVAVNVRAIGGVPILVGVVGDDAEARLLEESLSHLGVAEATLVADSSRPTTLKTRIVAANSHVLRIDRELWGPVSDEIVETLDVRCRSLVQGADALVLSDYQKGVLTERLCRLLIAAAHDVKIPVIVDPKGEDFAKYAGAMILTPNEREAEIATRIRITDSSTLRSAARSILAHTESTAVIITRGRRGMTAFLRDGSEHHVDPITAEVADVTGAGDVVTAIFGLGSAAGLNPVTCARLATVAAAVAVRKVGTAPANYEEILHVLSVGDQWFPQNSKIQTLEGLARAVSDQRAKGLRIVVTNGCFDLLHSGHIHTLQTAKAQADILIVAINSDSSVGDLKGPGRPVMRDVERATLVAALSFVDYVVVFSERTAERVVATVRPDVYVKGADYVDQSCPEADIIRKNDYVIDKA